jgi:hypothetical protein
MSLAEFQQTRGRLKLAAGERDFPSRSTSGMVTLVKLCSTLESVEYLDCGGGGDS